MWIHIDDVAVFPAASLVDPNSILDFEELVFYSEFIFSWIWQAFCLINDVDDTNVNIENRLNFLLNHFDRLWHFGGLVYVRYVGGSDDFLNTFIACKSNNTNSPISVVLKSLAHS